MFWSKKIIKPRLGVLNLMKYDNLVRQDLKVLSDCFSSVEESNSEFPLCDVLMIYGQINQGGQMEGFPYSFFDPVKSTGARIVIIATGHLVDQYVMLTKNQKISVNLVMTLDRKEGAFAEFLKNLFELMLKGMTMPNAWNQLAPQIPNLEMKNMPDTLFVCGAGQVSFR